MTLETIVTTPNPTTVLVLRASEIDALDATPHGAKLLIRPDVAVLRHPAEAGSDLAERLDREGLLAPGTLLVQSPFDPHHYEPLDRASDVFSLHKYALISLYCAQLGARELRVEEVALTRTKSESVASATVTVGAGNSARVDVEDQQLREFTASLSLRDVYAGTEPDLAAAEATLSRYRLTRAPMLAGLLALRASSNPIRVRTLCVNLTSECSSRLRVAAGLLVASGVSVDAAYNHAVNNQSQYRLTVTVEF